MLQTRVAEEPSRYRLNRLAGEVSRFNPAAVRGPNGIWNEDTLPVMEWEAAEYRIVLPADLQRGMQIEQPVLRWEESKRTKAFLKHPSITLLDFSDAGFWSIWLFFGPEPTKRIAWNVFFSVGTDAYLASISKHFGELTFTTVFRPRPEWLEVRIKAGAGKWTSRIEEKGE